jgi:hypothetical protein
VAIFLYLFTFLLPVKWPSIKCTIFKNEPNSEDII